MTRPHAPHSKATTHRWITRGVIGIVVATFFSDVAHEMVTAVLPMYLTSIGLGAASLGAIEGFADFVFSASKLGGGVLGHRVHAKRPLVAFGYFITMVGTASMGLVRSATALASLRGAAWIGRGFRSPLRDFLLADEVEPTHYGRAYGIERSADMLGALAGPLIAVLLVSLSVDLRTIIVWSLVPAAIPVIAILALTRDRDPRARASADAKRRENDARQRADERGASGAQRSASERAAKIEPDRSEHAAAASHVAHASHVADDSRVADASLPTSFKRFLPGVLMFGLGDFSRTFLILLASRALGESGKSTSGTISIAVLLYVAHNGISALAAYPIGRLADRVSKLDVLIAGYALGAATNVLLALTSGSIAWLVVAIALSGIYIAVEETVEKAAAAEMLSREKKSLGFGVLAAANALGDMISSIGVGVLLGSGRTVLAFALPALAGVAGTAWMALVVRGRQSGARRA
jgi:MFS family permease